MNKKGMTLIELLVYMAIAALLLAPVIMRMQNSSLNMARDAVTTDLRISGRDILNIMYEDIRNTGFKLIDATGNVDTSVTFIVMNKNVNPPVPAANSDPSSIRPGDGGPGTGDGGTINALDTLTIRKGHLHSSGQPYLGYYEVTYYVDNDTLKRTSKKFNYAVPYKSSPDTTTSKNIASNVAILQFEYSPDLNDWYDNPSLTSSSSTKKDAKKDMKYIKISVVTIDKKKLSPVKTFSPIDIGNYHYKPINLNDQALREISEIVVPIPNNGLFP
jgi:prepilin-type N-terminal cleavage/methylation domain-containing protein